MKRVIINNLRRLIGIDKVLRLQTKIFNELNQQKPILNEVLKANQFTSSIQDSNWLFKKSFSPGNYAVDYAFLYSLYRVLNDFKPKKIVEFGLGQSSKMISQYSEYFNVESIILEHDEKWHDFFMNSFEMSKMCDIKISNLITVPYRDYQTIRYEDDILNLAGKNIELVILDGPFGSPRFSRPQIFDLIPDGININHFCIMVDDYQRRGEIDTAEEIISSLSSNGIRSVNKKYFGQKEHLLICSENNAFLTSL